MRTSILTGATGFIGSALVLELLEHTDADVVAIVRPGSISAEERMMGILRQVAAGFGDRDRALDQAQKRLQVVEGDVRDLGPAKSRLLGKKDAHFWHVAASLQYENRFAEEIFETNVEGTRNAMNLARQLGVERFHHVSTAYVAGCRSGVILENDASSGDTHNVYEQSKIASEALVRGTTDLDWRIYRPSIVIGHSRTLAANSSAGLYGFVRRLDQFRRIMQRTQPGLLERQPLRLLADPEGTVDLMPVDLLVEQMVRVGISSTKDRIFHLTNPGSMRIRDALPTSFGSVGLPDPVITKDTDRMGWLDKKFDQRISFFRSYLAGTKIFSRDATDRALGTKSWAHAIDGSALHRYCRWFLDLIAGEAQPMPATR